MFEIWMVLCFGVGLGLCLIVSGQEWWERPRPDLRTQLRRLAIDRSDDRDRQPAPETGTLYRTSVLERLMRPLADDVGRILARLIVHVGIGSAERERELALAGQPMTLPQFVGQKVLAGLVGLAIFPIANLLDLTFGGPWPVEAWLGGFVLGFLLPDWLIAARLRSRHEQVQRELPVILDLLAIAISAGMGLEQALQTVANQGSGVLTDAIRGLVREMALGQRSLGDLLSEWESVDDDAQLKAVIGGMRSALAHGSALGEMLAIQAEVARERAQARLVEAGGRATLVMLVPVGVLILPAYILVILFPAAIQILGLAG